MRAASGTSSQASERGVANTSHTSAMKARREGVGGEGRRKAREVLTVVQRRMWRGEGGERGPRSAKG